MSRSEKVDRMRESERREKGKVERPKEGEKRKERVKIVGELERNRKEL